MNEIVKAPTRRKFTLAELDRLSAVGLFGEHEHVELIGGELFTKAPKGIRHENLRGIIAESLMLRLPPAVRLREELGWRPTKDAYFEPDLLLYRAGNLPATVPPADVLLIIEIAKSSLAHDLGLKAEVYAALGISEYWVVDAARLVAHVHHRPTADRGYLEKTDLPAVDELVPLLVPELALRLADFDFGSDSIGEDDP